MHIKYPITHIILNLITLAAVQVVNMQINGLSELLQTGVNKTKLTRMNHTTFQSANQTTIQNMKM